MAPADEQPTESTGAGTDDELIGTLINEFFDRRQRGEDLSQEDFLAEHTEHAEVLREHLVGLRLLDKIGSSSRLSTMPGEKTVPAKGSSARDQIADTSLPPPKIEGYEILKMIGRGGMGVVYKAIQHSTQREVALKILLEGPLASDQTRRRFEREIAVAARLSHPNIIPIYDSATCDGRMYYTMEYVRGSSLVEYSLRHKQDIKARLGLFCKICQAITNAHLHGVVHRDLKPSNILVDAQGEPHILDFGLAKAAAHIDVTTSVTAQIVGTPAYMSPEQAAGDPSGIDMRTDIYSLGVVLYQLLTDRMPYETRVPMGKLLDNIGSAEPDPPDRHNPKVDAELSAIALKALEKSKDQRYQSVDAFCQDIRSYLAGEPISVRAPSGAYLLKKVLWKHRLVVGIAAAVVVLAAAIGLVVRDVSTQRDAMETRIREKEHEVVAQKEEAERIKEDAVALQRQRDEAERYRAAYEALGKTIDPRLGAVLDAVAKQVAQGGDPAQTITNLLAKGVSELDLETPDERTRKPIDDLGLEEPEFSPKPPGLSKPEPATNAAVLSPEALEEILRRLLLPPANSTANPPAATQPAATQPSEVAATQSTSD